MRLPTERMRHKKKPTLMGGITRRSGRTHFLTRGRAPAGEVTVAEQRKSECIIIADRSMLRSVREACVMCVLYDTALVDTRTDSHTRRSERCSVAVQRQHRHRPAATAPTLRRARTICVMMCIHNVLYRICYAGISRC